MKNRFFFIFIFAICVSLFCCAQEQEEKKEILAKINDYELTLKEYEYQLVAELEMDKDFKLTSEAKKEFLDQLIEKELLIQEAKRLKLDREERFIRTIERYWEATLIRDLMDLKGKEIIERASVTEEEVKLQYEKMKQSGVKPPPFEKIREKLTREVREAKKRENLVEWMKELRKDAKIEINKEMLK